MRRVAIPVGVTMLLAACAAAQTSNPAGGEPPQEAKYNLLPNPSLELVEPPLPTPQTATQPAKAEDWIPRTWNPAAQWGAEVSCPDDKTQAHTGRRCFKIKAAKNQQGVLRYFYIPIPQRLALTVRFSARGEGQLSVAQRQFIKDHWTDPTAEAPVTLTKDWKQYQSKLAIAEGGKYVLEIANPPSVATEAWIDDVFASYPGMTELPWPPAKPLGKDKNTLLYLTFDKWFDEDVFFVKPKAELAKDGPFGSKCLHLGAQGYVACSANENLDCRQGTIEVWFRLLTPAADGLSHPVVTVPGMDGMWMGMDQYCHVGCGFSNGWRGLCGCNNLGYAGAWQPGVWRHMAFCWDKKMLQLFVDGKLVAWEIDPKLPRYIGPELGIGSPNMDLADLRISKVVRYRQSVPPAEEKKP